jgi:hypothetical protein
MIAVCLAAIFCVVQCVRDILKRNYGWATAAGLCALLLLTTPFQTHAVKIDLPAPSAR